MTVQFDEASGLWRVVDDTGTIIAAGFASDVEAWRWHDARSEADLYDLITHERISNAIRRW